MTGDAGRNLRISGLSPTVYMRFTKLVRMSHFLSNDFNELAEIAYFLCNHEITLCLATIRSARPPFSPTLSTSLVDSVSFARDSPKTAMGCDSFAAVQSKSERVFRAGAVCANAVISAVTFGTISMRRGIIDIAKRCSPM